jgi:AcrR family transcriptional regulator
MSPLFLEVRMTRRPGSEAGEAVGLGETGRNLAHPGRPLRRDAERNRQRILKAAAEVFTERGLGVSLDEVARHAGVGVGTVYRRFGTKEELIQALFVDRVESIATLAEQATQVPDPWSGLVCFMEQMAEMLAGDLGLRQMLMLAGYGHDVASYARRRNAPLVGRLVERAQASGQLRSDLSLTDIPFLVFLLTEAAQLARPVSPELWRRYLALITDGMRPQRDGVTPLPVRALLPDEMEKTMREQVPRPQSARTRLAGR